MRYITLRDMYNVMHLITRIINPLVTNYNEKMNSSPQIFTHNNNYSKKLTQGVNCILSRMLHYAQKNSYGAVSFQVYTCSYKFYTILNNITGRLPVQYTYFWERLSRNFEYACKAVAKVDISICTNL